MSVSPENLLDEVFSVDDADLGTLHDPKLPPVLTAEMSRLYASGFWLLPLGGPTGRSPLLKFTDSAGKPMRRHPLSLVIGKMSGAGSRNYALRLKGMLVIDIDVDTPEAQEYVRNRFGESDVQIKTSRGTHHYFQHEGPAPAKVRLPGIVIDFKTGEQQLAAGPFAERSDGASYYPLKGHLRSVEALPRFADCDNGREEQEQDQEPGLETGVRVKRGDRHAMLKKRAMQLVWAADDERSLFDDLVAFREWECEFADEVLDSEVERIARWFWFKRCNNELWCGRNSPMGMTRASFDSLINLPYGDQAWLLYSYVYSNHEHLGREFAIVPEGILNAGKLKALSAKDIRRAAKILVNEKLLWRREVRTGFKRMYLYRIAGGSRGGGARDYISDQYGNTALQVIDGGQA